MQRPLLLASTSPFRRAILDGIGLEYDVDSPLFDEDHAQALAPKEMALAFARGKAKSLADRYPNHWICGSDQIPALEGEILTKPGTTERAVAQLLKLSGKTHQLITAVVLYDPATDLSYERVIVHEMTLRTLGDEQARAYVRQDGSEHCAGAYKVEGLGSALFHAMKGSDHTGIIGLPVSVLGDLMEEAGAGWLERILPT